MIYNEAHMTDRWLAVAEIVEHLGVTQDTIYIWITERGMPAHRVGRKWRFQQREVDEWIRAGGAAADVDQKGEEST